ncbi:hypothetical protein LCDVSa104L [Lymphocystis disease virus 3]|uniref:Uncharacterized protein n=1 Tax=Lymphocystis disease virus 3 TaxID=2560566 RepID=A0A1B2RW16_9VIRU|nr:hypothetical protein BZK12_gp104 [Lymphocystis disease virus Sa]AOC55188.1 hypothetical protein LCDVSa104L [Lymphocystis disease virus 3]
MLIFKILLIGVDVLFISFNILSIILFGWMTRENPLAVFICILIINVCFIVACGYNMYAALSLKKRKLILNLVVVWILFFVYVFLSVYILLTSDDLIERLYQDPIVREICKKCDQENLIKHILFIVLNLFNAFLTLQIIFSTIITSVTYNTQRSFRLTNIIA